MQMLICLAVLPIQPTRNGSNLLFCPISRL